MTKEDGNMTDPNRLREKLIITAAITGSQITRETAPYIPMTTTEIIQSAIECWRAGAAIAHIHVRDPETGIGTQVPGQLPGGGRGAAGKDRSCPVADHQRHSRT